MGMSEGLLENLRDDGAFFNETLQKFVTAKQSATVAPDQPVVPFEQGLPPELMENTSPTFQEAMDSIVKKNVKSVDCSLQEPCNQWFKFFIKRKQLVKSMLRYCFAQLLDKLYKKYYNNCRGK